MDFYVYKLEFEKDSQTNLLNNGVAFDLSAARKKWGENIRSGSLPLAFINGSERIPAFAPIDAFHDDVALLRFHNVKSVKQWEMLANEPNRLSSFPHCVAIIDNREGHQQVLIEKNEAFGCNPHKAMIMLSEYANNFLMDYGFKINLYSKCRKGEIWDLVKVNESAGHPVKSVKFILRNLGQIEYGDIPISKSRKSQFKSLAKAQREYGCAVTEITHKAAKDKGLSIYQQLGSDFVEMLAVADENGYDLELAFHGAPKHVRHNGKGKTSSALYTMPAECYSSFLSGQLNTSGSFNMLEWMDEIRKTDNASDYADKPIN